MGQCICRAAYSAPSRELEMMLADWLLPALGVRQYMHELAHAAGVVVPVFTSYLGHKHLSFK